MSILSDVVAIIKELIKGKVKKGPKVDQILPPPPKVPREFR